VSGLRREQPFASYRHGTRDRPARITAISEADAPRPRDDGIGTLIAHRFTKWIT
jgi:hypothetical protein